MGSMSSKGWEYFPFISIFLLKKLRAFVTSCQKTFAPLLHCELCGKQRKVQEVQWVQVVGDSSVYVVFFTNHQRKKR
jgi:hypothetical protein